MYRREYSIKVWSLLIGLGDMQVKQIIIHSFIKPTIHLFIPSHPSVSQPAGRSVSPPSIKLFFCQSKPYILSAINQNGHIIERTDIVH